ncbi:MAG TPA: RNA methyltransferase [Bacteroidia bacterium]|jgi:TrmH family RNA methyltransferase
MELITSTSNPRIKNIVKLQEKASERRAQGLFVVEGAREIGFAVGSGYRIQQLFYCEEVTKGREVEVLKLLQMNNVKAELVKVTKDVFSKIAYREGSDGLIGITKPKDISLEKLQLSKEPLLIILESVEKPGNLGAILRTADAAKVDAVIICDPKTDVFNPNVVRASIGTLFTGQIAVCTNDEALNWLKKNRITPYAAALTATKSYTEVPLDKSSAIVMGTEANGLSDFWLTKAEQIKIPMLGKIDSLNVSTSCAVIVFEAVRQRS